MAAFLQCVALLVRFVCERLVRFRAGVDIHIMYIQIATIPCRRLFATRAAMEKSIFTRDYEILLELLREFRDRAQLTQVELAERIDENQVFVSRLERGESRLDVVQLRTICAALGLSLRAFIKHYEKRLEAEEL